MGKAFSTSDALTPKGIEELVDSLIDAARPGLSEHALSVQELREQGRTALGRLRSDGDTTEG